MAWQKMAILAVAGFLCMSALLNGAEATESVSSSSLLNNTAEQCGNFAASCSSITVIRNILAAKCKTKNGTPVPTSLDLNPHIGNDDGKLVAGGQNYIKTCDPKGYGRESSQFLIFAQCKKKNGNAIETSYDINKNVANIDGVLEWENCNQLLANIVDEFAAVEEEIALNGRKLLNQ
ncbi:unnamed protein product [Sphagnum troendelagicum]|uniref:Cyanovirin-N domain-containing protein n=1 Tax=Sphagnum troendelagicum TaxID=128251 RepID=A0ABP0ULI3_9BRYO